MKIEEFKNLIYPYSIKTFIKKVEAEKIRIYRIEHKQNIISVFYNFITDKSHIIDIPKPRT